ncbi:ICMT-domain-containing protein [Neoconidiobolus thromboides FSU 785]|nr:ICMT-domain-containing protein [Neoconidiobolus thromboides FSU 785]
MSLSSSPRKDNIKNWLGVGKESGLRSRSSSINSTISLDPTPKTIDLENSPPPNYQDFKNEFILAYQQGDHIPATIAVYASFAGILIGFGLSFALFVSGYRAFGMYVMALGGFHLLEYLITAIFNPRRVKLDSFLYDPVSGYHIALLVSVAEYFLKKIYYPWVYNYVMPIQLLGFLFVLVGQWFRSRAMIEANTSFNHYVQSMKDQDHHLITTGVFSIARHPSYLGFYLFTLGTQIMLFNPLCFSAFCFVLHQFFKTRIRVEEAHLIRFFGQEYINYRDHTPTYLPLIH